MRTRGEWRWGCPENSGLRAAAAEVELRSERISVSFNERMQRQIQWLPAAGANVVAFDPAGQEGVIVSGRICTAFRLDPDRFSQKRIVDPEFGSAMQAIAIGAYRESEIAIERQLRVLLPEKYPDVAIFQSTYRNLGKTPLHLDKIYSQRILLDGKRLRPHLAETRLPAEQFPGRRRCPRRRGCRGRHAVHRCLGPDDGRGYGSPGERAAVGFPARAGSP